MMPERDPLREIITAEQMEIRTATSFNIPTWCGVKKTEFNMDGDDFTLLEQYETEIEVVLPQKRILGIFLGPVETFNLIETFTVTEPSNFQSPGEMTIPAYAEISSGKTIRIDCREIELLPTALDDTDEVEEFLIEALGDPEYFHGALTIDSETKDLRIFKTDIVRSTRCIDQGSGLDCVDSQLDRTRTEITGIRANLNQDVDVDAAPESRAQNIVWTNNQDDTILTCPAFGAVPCTSTMIADNATSGVDEPRGVVVVDDVLYWANNGDDTLRSCPIGGAPCASTIIGDNANSGVSGPIGIFVDDGRIYWANPDDNTVRSCAIGATPCTDVTIHANDPNTDIANGPTDVFVDGDVVYWSQNNSNAVRGCDVNDAPCEFPDEVIIIANNTAGAADDPRGIFIDNDTLYFSNEDDQEIRTCPLVEICTSSVFANLFNFGGTPFANGLFVDGILGIVYWVDSTNEVILSCPTSGPIPCDGPDQTVFADNGTSGADSPQYVWGY